MGRMRGLGAGGSGRPIGWRLRRVLATVLGPVLAAGSSLVPVAFTVSAAVAVSAVGAAVGAAPARASSGSVLILSTSVNGGTASAEAAAATAAGATVTVASASTWDAMTTAQFKAYSAIIIGDPSTTSCATSVPSDALSTAATWGAAVTGNVTVAGTAPAFAGSAGTSLIKDSIGYALAGSGTGLYVSLNCEYKTSSAGTSVPLLAGVDGGGFTVTGQGPTCQNSGTVNTAEGRGVSQFNNLSGSALASWASPACSVQETLNSWPAQFTGLGYDAAATPADFTASDGVTGQPYVLLGAPVSAATQALAPTAGGEVPAGAAIGGSNPAAPGVSQATAGDPVNTESGDFTQAATDSSVPTFGPSLGFTRTYDAGVAGQQTQAGTPGPLGYGWTDNWASSLSAGNPVPADIYTLDGYGRWTPAAQGGPPRQATMNGPYVYYASSGTYVSDSGENRIYEIPATSGTQWGQAMTAGDVYIIAGSIIGESGDSPDDTAAGQFQLNSPGGVTIDQHGNLYIADSGNNRVVEMPASSGTQWGHIAMTAGDLYTVAGGSGGGLGADQIAATSSDLNGPTAVTTMPSGSDVSLYIADAGNNRVQEVAAAGQTEWNQSMTAGDVYTVAGSSAGTSGYAGDGGAATAAKLNDPLAAEIDSSGNLFIADTANSRVQEVPAAGGTQWGHIAMTKYDMYTVAGSATGVIGSSGDGGAATAAQLDQPNGLWAGGGQLYIADTANNRIQEVAGTGHAEWGQNLSAGDVYTIAGDASGTLGYAGDGGAAASALLDGPGNVALDSAGNLLIADTVNNEVRKVAAATAGISDYAGGAGTIEQEGDGGPAVNAGLDYPFGVASDAAGDIFIADSRGNRVQEIAAKTHTQFGIVMTAGDVYTVAGSAAGYPGDSGDGGAATAALLDGPEDVALDAAGNIYITDTWNYRIQKVSAATGIMSTIAGTDGQWGNSGDGGPAAAALLERPDAATVDAAGNLYIADAQANQVREVPAASGNGMTAGDIYTIAGDPGGTAGTSGDGGPAASALLSWPADVEADPAGNLYISDGNNRIQEIAAASHLQWGQQMTGGDVYTIAGSVGGTVGNSGDGGPATAATLNGPAQVTLDKAGDLYITDEGNNRVREVPAASGTQWAQSMTAGDIYNVAGLSAGTWGETGDGGPATAAQIAGPAGITIDPAGNLFIDDSGYGLLREVTATSTPTFPEVPGPGALTVTQPGGSQVTFYSPGSDGNCAAPYVTAGDYCTLPQNVDASLTYNSAAQTYTYTPSPGATYTYGWNGALTGESNAAGDALAIAYDTPASGSGQCPSAASLCETVTAASGRALVIGSNSGGLVTSVTDPLGRRWTYAYTGSDLTSVTDPMSRVTSYTYGVGSTSNPLLANDLLTITSPNAQPGGPDAGHSTVNVYDAAGQVTSQTDPMGFRTTFDYSGLNAYTGSGVVRAGDPDGNTTVYDYSQGALAAESAWTGSTLVSEQDYIPDLTAGGTVGGTLLDTATADGDGNITTSTYDAAGNVTSTTSPDGVGSQTATTTQASTALDNADCASTSEASSTCSSSAGPSPVAPGGTITPPSSAPPQGVTWTLYDTDGNELYTTTGVYQPGATTASYRQTTYQLFKGNSVTLNSTNISCTGTPPSRSLPCATINADGVVTQLGYDAQGGLTSSSTPDGNSGGELATTTSSYDGDGEQTSMTSPDGNLSGANAGNYTTVTAWNADGQQTSVSQGAGTGHTVTTRVTSYGYDADGNPTTVQGARGYTTTTTYNADARATLAADPDGNATLTCYDGDGRVAQTIPPVGVAASSLTLSSCPTSYPSGYSDRLASDATTYTFNGLGQKIQMTTPAPASQSGSETTSYSYDGNGKLIQTTAPPTANGGQNQVTQDTYTSTGELAAETTGYGTSSDATVSYCYDPNGNRTSVVYADGNTTGTASCETSSPWVVSSSSNPTQASYQTTYVHDSASELVSATAPVTAAAPSGATTTETYDAAGNSLTRTDPKGVTITWTYTPLNKPATVSYSGSSAHSVTYGHDASGNRTSMTDATGSSSSQYDSFGQLTSATNGAGQTVGYGYNADGTVDAITYPLSAGATWASTDTVSYGYDHADLLTSVTDFNGNQITIGNTADGLPNSVGLGSTGDTISTTYDNGNSPSAISLKNSASTLQSFTYGDSPAGTILSETDTPASAQSPAVYTYDAKGRVTSMTPGTGSALNYGFDASSNLMTLPTGATGSYDKAGELASSTSSGTTTNYTYNADGQRLTAQQGSTAVASGSWNGAGQLTAYNNAAASMTAASYDGDGLRAAATTGAGTQDFTWNTVASVPQLIMDSANAYIYCGGGTPAEQVNLSRGTSTYLVADSLGSVRGTVSSSGALAGSTSYDAWGNPEASGGLSSATPFGYAGGYTDPTGLIYLINRYYDPQAGQFISLDPAISQTIQPYAYADGNPVSVTDPTGLCGFLSWCAVVAFIAGGVVYGACMAILRWPNFCWGVGAGVGNVVSVLWNDISGHRRITLSSLAWAFLGGFAAGFFGNAAIRALGWGLGEGMIWVGERVGWRYGVSLGKDVINGIEKVFYSRELRMGARSWFRRLGFI
jgi:trimeric autotransporter adhesin